MIIFAHGKAKSATNDFDVCWEFFVDNSEKFWGWYPEDEYTETEFLTEIDSDD